MRANFLSFFLQVKVKSYETFLQFKTIAGLLVRLKAFITLLLSSQTFSEVVFLRHFIAVF